MKNKKIFLTTIISIIIIILASVILIFWRKNNVEKPKKEFLSFADFPFKDDIATKSIYIKFNGPLSYLQEEQTNDVNGRHTFIYDKYKFVIDCNSNECVTGTTEALLMCTSNSLKLNDKIIYKDSSEDKKYKEESKYPYIIITNDNIIIQTLNKLYILDSNGNIQLSINNINEEYKNIRQLNNSLNFALKNNIFYYTTINDNNIELKYINLKEQNIEEKIIETVDKNTELVRNKEINSISQFPYNSTEKLEDINNKYKIKVEFISNEENDYETLIIEDSNGRKTINDFVVSWYVNPNNLHYNLLGENKSYTIIDDMLYYVIYEAENAYALYGANLNNKEFKYKKIEEFNKIDYSFEKIKYYLENCEEIRD